MSTKTTLKRIALVAVSAMGFGLLSVLPASATQTSGSSVAIGTVPTARVGQWSFVPVKVYIPTTGLTAGTDTININAEVTEAPLSGGPANRASDLGENWTNATANAESSDLGQNFMLSATAVSPSNDAAGASATFHGRTNAVSTSRLTGCDISSGTSTGDGAVCSNITGHVITDAEYAQGYVSVYVAIKPDIAGSYKVLVSSTNFASGYGLGRTATQNQLFQAGDKSNVFTISTAGAPTSLTLTQLAGGSILAGSDYGVPIAVSTVGGAPGANDVFDVTTSGSGTLAVWGWSGAPSSYATTKTLTSSNFNNGTAIVYLKNTGSAAQTISLTVTGSGGLSTSVSATKTFSVVAGGSATAMTYEKPSSTADYAGTDMTEVTTGTVLLPTTSTSQCIGFTFTDYAATKRGFVTVTDTQGTITGVAGLMYDLSYSVASGDEGKSLCIAGVATASMATASAVLATIAIPTASSTTLGVASGVTKTLYPTAASETDIEISPNSTFIAAPGAAIALTGTLTDQFGNTMSGKTVNITTTGRNNPTGVTRVTDSDGEFTFTTADSSTSTTNLLDTISFVSSGASASVTINYGNTAVSTVVVTGGYTTSGVDALTATTNDIGAGATGAQAVAHTFSALVKDANSNALAGIAVAWTISGTGCAIKSTSATSYTDSTGTASASVYGWLAGTCTVTATAGGKTGSGKIKFAQNTTTEARTVTAAASGAVVTATVKDRFGNPVKGVTVYATKTGDGYFGSGVGRTSTTTDLNGNAQFTVAGGDASVTVSVIDYDAVAGTTFGQTCALEGYGTCPTTTTSGTALTATTVGTATTAETGVGASYNAAGVASATVSVTGVDKASAAAEAASDAALEAIDAANAATDAANLAAEAADAATVAAEEARDAADAATAAVEALASEVATLMAALKAQLTTLAKTVAKIAKKVKA